jgi:hypothetical protein
MYLNVNLVNFETLHPKHWGKCRRAAFAHMTTVSVTTAPFWLLSGLVLDGS